MALAAGVRLGVYEVVDPLGAGGMGEVYRARDTRLGREVALKALPAEFSRDPSRLARFEREARMLAALNHPAVAAIYGLEEVDETQFIVMELVPGETLSEKLSHGPVILDEAISIARQIAEALEAAHERGIIHRDLKPANIKVTPAGRVKVLDLGLAKAFDTRDTGSDSDLSLSPTLVIEGTQPGVILGTAEFMSPEQARGKPVDKRTDIWAFGCILYELLTGHRAFTGETTTDVLAAIVTTDPDWDLLPASTPGRIRELLGRCLQKDPARRLRDVGDARIAIDDTLAAGLPSGAAAPSGARPRDARTPSRPASRTRWATLAGVALLAAAAVGIWSTLRARGPGKSPPERKYLAVLPFKDLSGTAGGQLVGDGLVETVSVRLSTVSGIQVVTPTASVTASDKSAGLQRIARDLGANLLLRGTYQRQRDRVRITYSVVDSTDGNQIAGGSIDGSAADLFEIQDRLAERVATSLRLPSPMRPTGESIGLVTADEQDRYLRAIGNLQRYDKADRIDEAVRLLEPLARERPSAAIVHAALGRAYLHRFNLTREPKWIELASAAVETARKLQPGSIEVDSTLGELYLRTGRADDAVAAYRRALASQPGAYDATLGLARAYDAAGDALRSEQTYRRAIELQPAYFGGYSKLGGFYFNRGRWANAAQAFHKVTELAPDNARAFANVGACYFELGDFERALREFRRSVALEPTDIAYSNLGTTQFYLRRYPEAAAAFERAAALSPSQYANWVNLGDALRRTPGRQSEAAAAHEKGIALARAELETNPDAIDIRSHLALFLAKTGKTAEAERELTRVLAAGSKSPEILFNAAIVANRAGRPDRALNYLSQAVRGGFNPAIIRNEPELANLKDRRAFSDVVGARAADKSR